MASNKRLQEQNDALHAKVDSLTSKVDELLDEIRNAKSDSTDTRNPMGEQQPETASAEGEQQSIQQPQHQHQPQQPQTDHPAQTSKENQPRQDQQRRAVNWSEVVKSGLGSLPDVLKHRVKETVRYLQQDGFQAKRTTPSHANNTQPSPVAVYFGNIPRGPIGKLKRCLQECLPKWAVLSISFIGANFTVILCHQGHVERRVATMRLLRYKNIAGYDPTLAAPRDATPDQARSYRAACLRRWQKLASQSLSPVCKQCYEKSATDLLESDEGLDEVQPPSRKPRTPGLAAPSSTAPAPATLATNTGGQASEEDSDDDVEDDDSFLTPREEQDNSTAPKTNSSTEVTDEMGQEANKEKVSAQAEPESN